MRILCLYNNDIALDLFDWIKEQGNDIVVSSDRLSVEWCISQNFDLVVSYTYRYILSTELIKAFNNNVVNLHTSYLPFNRGADPNIWSVIDGTPRGVTLHYIDEKLDHGDIIAQKLIDSCYEGTLSSSYKELDAEAKKLFKTAFKYYLFWGEMRKGAKGIGTYRQASELTNIKKKISSYDITISEFLKEIKL